MPGVVVDGQDLDAVGAAVTTAVERARAGKGPTLLEMKTYRYSGHSRSDPATYRRAGELEQWLGRDPIVLFAERLTAEGTMAKGDLDRVRAEVKDSVERAVAEVLAAAQPGRSEILAHVTA
jgi:pyruvate dehydrogenase E1 component alpha subunit